jgi:hypothetical protein
MWSPASLLPASSVRTLTASSSVVLTHQTPSGWNTKPVLERRRRLFLVPMAGHQHGGRTNAWRHPQAKIARELVLRTTVEAFPGILLVSYAWRQVGIPRGLSRSLVSVG